MYIELSKSEAMDILLDDDNANWSYDAAEALIDYYEQREMDLGEDFKFNRAEIRGEWTEYDTHTLEMDFGYMTNDGGHDERAPCRASREDWDLSKWADFLRERTFVIELDDSLLIAEF